MTKLVEANFYREAKGFLDSVKQDPLSARMPEATQSDDVHKNIRSVGLSLLAWLTLQNKLYAHLETGIDLPTIGFLQAAFQDQAHLEFLANGTYESGSDQYQESRTRTWNDTLNVLGIYLFSGIPEEKMVDLGIKSGETRQSIYEVKDRARVMLWKYSSPETKEKFPLPSIKASRTQGYDGWLKIKQTYYQMEDGGNIHDIAKKLHLNAEQKKRVVDLWVSQGGDSRQLRYPFELEREQLLNDIESAESKEELCELFSRVTLALLRSLAKEGDGTLVPLMGVDGILTYRHVRKSKYFIWLLESRGIMMGTLEQNVRYGKTGKKKKLVYRFMRGRDQERAFEILKDDPVYLRYLEPSPKSDSSQGKNSGV